MTSFDLLDSSEPACQLIKPFSFKSILHASSFSLNNVDWFPTIYFFVVFLSLKPSAWNKILIELIFLASWK